MVATGIQGFPYQNYCSHLVVLGAQCTFADNILNGNGQGEILKATVAMRPKAKHLCSWLSYREITCPSTLRLQVGDLQTKEQKMVYSRTGHARTITLRLICLYQEYSCNIHYESPAIALPQGLYWGQYVIMSLLHNIAACPCMRND